MAPTNTHQVDVVRAGYAVRTFEIQAACRSAGVQRALERAGNCDFSEHAADYYVLGETTERGLPVLKHPLPAEILCRCVAAGVKVCGVVSVEFELLVGLSKSQAVLFLGRLLVGNERLKDVSFRLAGAFEGHALIEVTGDARAVVELVDCVA